MIDSEYELSAVLVHSGPQLGYGHYYALIRSPDGYWFRMNDMEVIPVNTKHVLREQGYIVFYRRRSNNLMKCQLKRIKAAKGVSTDNSEEYSNESNGSKQNQNESNVEYKEDPDDMDISSAELQSFGSSKLSTLSVDELKTLR